MREVSFTQEFHNSLLKLPDGEIKKVVKAFTRLQSDPNHPSLNLHPVREANEDFFTARASKSTRLVVHISGDKILVCHSDKHDEAYHWARSRSLRYNENANNLQIITINEETRPNTAYPTAGINIETPLFEKFSDSEILSTGVTQDQINEIRELKSEEKLYLLENKYPEAVYENLLALYLDCEMPNSQVSESATTVKRVVFNNSEEILQALSKPWEKWLIFLSSFQEKIVASNFNGPSKVFGGAGTGKTVVALHRSKYLIENSNKASANIALLTYSKVLAKDLEIKADMLLGSSSQKRNQLKVSSVEHAAKEIIESKYGRNYHVINEHTSERIIVQLAEKLQLHNNFSSEFIISEYQNVIGPWGLWSYKDYKNFKRHGRSTPLRPELRQQLSKLFEQFNNLCLSKKEITSFHLYQLATNILKTDGPRFDHIVVDEAQDLGPHMLAFVRALAAKQTNDIMLCGDSGQSIYRRHHSWIKHGMDVRGKSRKLYINYRTSRQIKETADLAAEQLIKFEGEETENRRSLSTFDGKDPTIKFFDNRQAEMTTLVSWVNERLAEEIEHKQIVVLSRCNDTLAQAEKALVSANIKCWQLDTDANFLSGEVGLANVNRVKGLEYRAVAIVGCDEDQFPNEDDLQKLGDRADFDEFLTFEKNLLYVAMTRARDHLFISGLNPGSPFLTDLGIK